MSRESRNLPPSPEELAHLGFEPWQISIVTRMPPVVQWEYHDQFVRILMSGGDTDAMEF